MSTFNKDPYRKVSEPTEADFLRGLAESAGKGGKANLLLALAVGFGVSKYIRRGK